MQMANSVLNKNKSNCGTAKMNTSRATAKCATIACSEIRIEQCLEGCKIYCICDDAAACAKLQDVCRMLDGGLCSIRCCRDGQLCCQCCLNCCECNCEMLPNGVCLG